MEKYITRDKLADFLEKMWDSGIRCDFQPKDNRISIWSSDLNKVERVAVMDKRTYDSLIDELRNEFLPKEDPAHTMNTAE